MTSSEWYQQRQRVSHWQQRPCVVLSEFCQFHKLPNPKYVLRSNDGKAYWFDCFIGERAFAPSYICKNCWHQNDAIDYISTQTFIRLLNEYKQTTIDIRSTSRMKTNKPRGQHIRFQDVGMDHDPNPERDILNKCPGSRPRANLELFHKELKTYQERKRKEKEERQILKKEAMAKGKRKNLAPLFSFQTSNNVDSDDDHHSTFFMGNVPLSTVQPSKFDLDFGGMASFTQQPLEQPTFGQPSVQSTSKVQNQLQFFDQNKPVQHTFTQTSVPLPVNIQEQVQMSLETLSLSQEFSVQENSTISPAVTIKEVSETEDDEQKNANEDQQIKTLILDMSSITFDCFNNSKVHSTAWNHIDFRAKDA
ncbi:8917_t:CDS:1 [Funneliformis mosseae]|uniref:8917_t:CDS:1 n=1 Tax=Funneliformis mosseae TaxID=27381 RepID=A0A9N8YT82_FUNMO|nr:8917_t:CDS:1 [Funneliformis mosseae]